ncbi:glycoside hydrolase family 16 protein [Frankia sp. AgPm24]|uniref:glycoside hydrolase family 16 protein n=1 Tax=Frankia sp. AgPm24 TaxID=631128 RepID=UPI002010AF20|nr:glycoside hydrolase family 16 protein [Frankia sp. AgPm24]MCK9923869.1 glycoside hydrolase family 16 protein [Frankia sp. AgPm24]
MAIRLGRPVMLAVVGAVVLAVGFAPAADATSHGDRHGSPDTVAAPPSPTATATATATTAAPAAARVAADSSATDPLAGATDPAASPSASTEPSASTAVESPSATPSAATETTGARLRLVVFEQDIVLVSARGLPAQAPVTLAATAAGLGGTTTTRTDADGRLIVGFLVPAGYDGTVTVTATSGETSATSTLKVIVPTAAPHATSSTSSSASSASPSATPAPSATPTASDATASDATASDAAPSAATPSDATSSPSPTQQAVTTTPTAALPAGAARNVTAGGASSQPAGPVSPGGRGWKLILGDDFDGTELDRAKWQLCNPSFRALCLPWNDEKQIYNTAATDNANVRVADGALHLTATRDAGGQIRSGMVSTGPWPASFGPAPAGYKPFSYTYGYYEGRVRIPRGNGFWPSMWQLPAGATGGAGWPDTGEMDVFEIPGNNPTEYHFTAHWGGGGGECNHPCSPQQATISDASAGWHVFGLDWEPDGLTWYVDGVKRGHTVSDPGAVKNTPFYVIANFSVGGTWGPLGGGVDASTPFPASMDIDYLRVYQRA